LRHEQCQCQAANPDPEAQDQIEEGDIHHRIPVSRAGRPQAEGARSGMRYGAAALGILAKLATVIAPPRGAGARNSRLEARRRYRLCHIATGVSARPVPSSLAAKARCALQVDARPGAKLTVMRRYPP